MDLFLFLCSLPPILLEGMSLPEMQILHKPQTPPTQTPSSHFTGLTPSSLLSFSLSSCMHHTTGPLKIPFPLPTPNRVGRRIRQESHLRHKI